MKRFILNLILLVAAISFMSGQELRPKVAFDMYINSHGYYYKIDYNRVDVAKYRTRLGLDFTGTFSKSHVVLKELRYTAFIDTHTYMNKDSGFRFNPTLMHFYIGASISYKNIKVQYKHLCIHPTRTQLDYVVPLDIYGGYDMITFSYGY